MISKNKKACQFYSVAGFGRKIAAEKANIPVYQLDTALIKHGIPSHHYNKAQTPEKIEIIKMNRQMGLTYKQLAVKYGMSVSTMHRYCTQGA